MKSSVVLIVLGVLLCLLIPTKPIQAYGGGPDTLTIGETPVVRNGFGTRSKMMLSLYDCSLYLPKQSKDSAQIIASDQPMAVRIEITSRFVSQAKMLAALHDGFRSSTGGNISAIDADIKKFSVCFSDPIKMGDVFVLAYAPETGVSVYKNDQHKGSSGGLEFKKAVMGIWLGENPIDANLKTAMLESPRIR